MLIWLTINLLVAVSAFKIQNVEGTEKSVPTALEMHPKTSLVLFATRHGNKNPNHYLKEHPAQMNNYDDTEKHLTPFGKVAAYNLGREIRQFVGDLISKKYNKTEVKFYSSSAVACQLTLQIVLAGFYPPKNGSSDWIKDAEWSPIPYTVSDPMLRMFALQKCPRLAEVWNPIVDETVEDMGQFLEEKKDLLNYIAIHTGWQPTIANVTELARNLIALKLYKSNYPEWIEHPTLPNYSKKRLVNDIMQFDEKSLMECADYEPCRDLMGGVWLQHILLTLKDKTEKTLPQKLIGYASHTEIILALMKLLNIDTNGLTTSAGFIIEYRSEPEPLIRILVHDPNPVEVHIIHQAKYSKKLKEIAYKDNWIPVQRFINEVKGKAIWDWEVACGRAGCSVAQAFEIIKTESESDLRRKFKIDSFDNSDQDVDCINESDALGEACGKFSAVGLCDSHDATRLLYCRRTCLCFQ